MLSSSNIQNNPAEDQYIYRLVMDINISKETSN